MRSANDDEPLLAADTPEPWAREFPVLVPSALVARTQTAAAIDRVRITMGFPAEVFVRAAWPVLEGYAAFVQLLPAAGSPQHRQPGGGLRHGLELAARALRQRRGQILPRGAAPEVIGAHAHRWTYAVLVAALVAAARDTLAGLRVVLRLGGREMRPWDPRAGSMAALEATAYRVEIVAPAAAPDDRHRGLAPRLFAAWVPAPVGTWLGEDPALRRELASWFAVDGDGRDGAIAELLRRAADGPGGTDSGRRPDTAGQRTTAASPAPAARGGDAAAADGAPEDREAAIVDAPERNVPPAPSRPAHPGVGAPATCGGPNVALPARGGGGEATAVARRFVAWLQAGIAGGTIRVNEPGALVHGVAEGMLLVSPRIFREFAWALGQERQEGGEGLPEDGAEAAKWVQRQVLRAGWHRQAPGGINILAYQVLRADRAVGRLSGVVIPDPGRFVAPAPPVNPLLVRVPAAGEGA